MILSYTDIQAEYAEFGCSHVSWIVKTELGSVIYWIFENSKKHKSICVMKFEAIYMNLYKVYIYINQ